MLLSCSDKVSNITISPSSPKNCYKPISKIAPIYSAKTVSSSRRQCKLLGWIMSVSFRGVYQRGSITHRPKSEIGPATSASFSFSLSLALSPFSTTGSWCAATEQPAAIAQDTRWCPVTLLHGNTVEAAQLQYKQAQEHVVKIPDESPKKKTHRPKSQKLTLTVRGWFSPSIINLLMVFLKLTDLFFCQ